MKKNRLNTYTFKAFFLTLLVISLAACSGGGGGSDSSGSSTTSTTSETLTSTSSSISGYVADGYLAHARVFLDRNLNRVYDDGEPMAMSADNGYFSLAVEAGEGDLYPVVVDVIAGQTIDQDNGLYVEDGYLLESPPGHYDFISPLTTLVNLELDKNPAYSLAQAVLSVKTQLGIADEVSLFDNYLDDGGSRASASVAASAEYGRTHRVAQTVARLMGLLRSDISQNLGRSLTTAETELLAYMVSDQISQYASLVKAAMEYERNYAVTTVVSDLVSDFYSRIAVATLDEELLDQYSQRVEQGSDEWDMTPPQVVSFSPQEDAATSIETVVTVRFDEALDETQVADDRFELIGPHGSVSGSLTYDADLQQLTFVANQVLLPYSEYEVVLKSTLADERGNALGEDISWTFTTIFDQTPPALPEF